MTEKQLQNLKPFNNRTESEQREITKKGGKASGLSRRKKKSLKEELKLMLETKQSNGKTVQENWAVALGQKILKGDVQASIFVRDTIGEKPVDKVEANVTSESQELLKEYLEQAKGGKLRQ